MDLTADVHHFDVSGSRERLLGGRTQPGLLMARLEVKRRGQGRQGKDRGIAVVAEPVAAIATHTRSPDRQKSNSTGILRAPEE